MDTNLEEMVTIERVELIARLAIAGCLEGRDNEVALGLIAEIATGFARKGYVGTLPGNQQ